MNNTHWKVLSNMLLILFFVVDKVIVKQERPKLPDDLQTLKTHSFDEYMEKVSDHIHQVIAFHFRDQLSVVITVIALLMIGFIATSNSALGKFSNSNNKSRKQAKIKAEYKGLAETIISNFECYITNLFIVLIFLFCVVFAI